ncbi:MAG TPA: type II toxin-antitoxin system YoeB family toxin [Spirochaetota bacterium]|nr:type II toxin-antitoxin system YoeB family toxin [Spirochaetota bacterium]
MANDSHLGKRLVGELEGNWSLRLNLKDRIVYSIDEDNKLVYIKRAKPQYGE